MSLHAFLLTPYANMPNYRLTSQEIDDVVVYILSLRRIQELKAQVAPRRCEVAKRGTHLRTV
jgi:hypothetical protein